jgi:glycerophosphoryl diester phosphodiesterase
MKYSRRSARLRLIAAGYALTLPMLLFGGGWNLVQLHTGWALPDRGSTTMGLVAHRGDLDRYPENTFDAIAAAAELRLDGIEFDVHQSADGTWWVVHDPTLERTTAVSGRVAELADTELEAAIIDGGLGFDASRHQGLRVPRLTDVLAGLETYPGTIYVDLQHAESGDASDLARLLEGRPAVVLCRSDDDAGAVKTVDPSIKTLVRFGRVGVDSSVDGWIAEAVHEATVRNVRSSRLPVVTYLDERTFGDDELPALRRAWSAGVEAFLTKSPRAALAAREELKRGEQ